MLLMREIYEIGHIPIVRRLFISIVIKVAGSGGNLSAFRIDRISEADPRIEEHQLWTEMVKCK